MSDKEKISYLEEKIGRLEGELRKREKELEKSNKTGNFFFVLSLVLGIVVSAFIGFL